MSSTISTRRGHHLHFIRNHKNNHATDDEDASESTRRYSQIEKPIRALSFGHTDDQLTTSNNRLQHLCSRLKRRLTLTKEPRTQSEDRRAGTSARRTMHFGNSKFFSSTVDQPSNDVDWPDFEKVYESVPSCLINALPGIDDFSIEEKYDYSLTISNFQADPTDQISMEKMKLFSQCKRGKNFRRNAICLKLDKSLYHGQLDIFIQQLMVEKLMRTWS